MGVRIEHGKPSTLISAAKRAGEAKAAQRAREQRQRAREQRAIASQRTREQKATIAQRASEQAMVAAARLREKQQDMEYRMTLRQQDIAIDLQMNERAKLWEIQKMELRSQVDFQREEQQRQRKLDSYDNALQQIDKEILAGRMTEEEAYPIKLKYEMNKMGVDIPTSLLPRESKVDPMKQLLQQYLTGEEGPAAAPTVSGRVRVISPTGQTGTIEAGELEEFKARGFRVIGEIPPTKKSIRKPIEVKTTPFTREFRGKF